jgi:hypothetical protein
MMILNFINRLNPRTKNIIGITFHILIIVAIASLVLCIVFGAIGEFAKLAFMKSLMGFCFIIFIITAGVLIAVGIVLLICFIIDAIRQDGLKKLLKGLIKTFSISFIISMVIHFIKYKNLEWIITFQYSLIITFSVFFNTAVGKFIEQKNSFNDSSDGSDISN